MADNTKIEFAKHTCNPWLTKNGTRVKTANWKKPLAWNRQASDQCQSKCDGNQCTKRLGHKGKHFALKPTGGWGDEEPQPHGDTDTTFEPEPNE